MIKKIKIPIEISARHIHLSQKDLDILFGKKYYLKKLKDLSQHGQFAAKEEVVSVKNKEYKFRVLGPVRKESQIEISRTGAIDLGLDVPLKLSGDLKKVKSFLEVKGTKGKVKVKVIVAKRHLHCLPSEAKNLGLKKNQKVKVMVKGERELVFHNVIVRPEEEYNLGCHIDTDEANACGLGKVCGDGFLIK
jgi:propanediol utilization protein